VNKEAGSVYCRFSSFFPKERFMARLSVAMISICAILMLASGQVLAADVANGKKLARKCTVCHGKLGVGKDPEVPHLAGQSALYIEKSLLDYQTGKRHDRRMTLMAKPLSRDDIKDLAAWFESLQISVKDPNK
jgi:cytochrome c553